MSGKRILIVLEFIKTFFDSEFDAGVDFRICFWFRFSNFLANAFFQNLKFGVALKIDVVYHGLRRRSEFQKKLDVEKNVFQKTKFSKQKNIFV